MTTRRQRARIMPFALAAALIAAHAAAQGGDPRGGERELARLGQQINTTGASANSGRVTDAIVEQWKGTEFRFDAASAPRELTAQDVQNLRQKRLGYGEISILLALAAKQDPATAKPFHEIVAMRQAGIGFGNLAQELGYRSLGEVVRSVKASAAGIDRVTTAPRAEKVETLGKPDRPERPVRPEKPERPAKPGR